MKTGKFITAGILCILTLAVSGCMLAAVGASAAGTVAYLKGNLEAVFDEDITKVYNASLETMDELQIPVIQKQKDQLAAKIVARNAQDKKITLKMSRTESGLTKLSIRFGLFGNQSQSQFIYDRIKKNL